MVVVTLWLRRHASWHGSEILAWAAVVVAATAAGLALAWPALLPVGGGPDLTHHLVLVDYIERHWRLVSEVGAQAQLGEMSQYTPGLHLLAALAGAWTRTDGLHALHALVAMSVGLKAGFVLLIALRVVPAGPARIPAALTAVVLSYVPYAYTIGSFAHDSFLAQVLAELFAVAMWWTLAVWDERPWPGATALCALFGAAVFLTWPVWIGPPLLTAMIVVAANAALPIRERLSHLALAIAPIALVAIIYAAGRIEWFRMAAATGAATQPSPATYGWLFLVSSTAGFAYAAATRRARLLLVFAGAVLLQAAALYVVARVRGPGAPYLALKMFYLLVYAQAVAAALVVALVSTRSRAPRRMAWSLAAVLAIVAGWQLTAAPRRAPVISEELSMAGRWARANIEGTCVDYLVATADTGYWLHLAMLGNSRTDPRTLDDDTFDPRKAFGRWILPGGLRYAIVDWTVAPREIRDAVDTLAQFGNVSVVSRRGPSTCS